MYPHVCFCLSVQSRAVTDAQGGLRASADLLRSYARHQRSTRDVTLGSPAVGSPLEEDLDDPIAASVRLIRKESSARCLFAGTTSLLPAS